MRIFLLSPLIVSYCTVTPTGRCACAPYAHIHTRVHTHGCRTHAHRQCNVISMCFSLPHKVATTRKSSQFAIAYDSLNDMVLITTCPHATTNNFEARHSVYISHPHRP